MTETVIETIVPPSDAFPYEIRSFPVRVEGGAVPAEVADWVQATAFGFHDGVLDDEAMLKMAASEQQDGRMLWGTYAESAPAGSWHLGRPVATYGSHRSTINTGAGRLLDAHLITAVTVRATHRRRGLLRRMITEDLVRARRSGRPMAALTASEATIYGRFGFGAATFTRRIEVDTSPKFALDTAPAGTVEVAEAGVLLDLAPQVFKAFHARTLGSVGRQDAYRHRVSGSWSYEKPEGDKAVRAALHYDADGTVDGYVSYKFAGWERSPQTLKVIDLIAASDDAYLGLWQYLASVDLVDRVTYDVAPEQDPLPWAMRDARGYKVTGRDDVLWLRVLDPVTALEGRHYEGDGALAVSVRDQLGIADGTYRIEAAGGKAKVERLAGGSAADVDLDVSALGSLYLGSARASDLAAAGRIRGTRDSVEALDRLFSTSRQPFCSTHF